MLVIKQNSLTACMDYCFFFNFSHYQFSYWLYVVYFSFGFVSQISFCNNMLPIEKVSVIFNFELSPRNWSVRYMKDGE